MSSLRNAIPKRPYKERSQPEATKKFGLLEKHKDYVQRAQAFHKKRDTIQKLKEKAENRNPDEFYFKMINTRTVEGVHKPGIEANKYSHDELMLMKSQDKNYVLHKLQSEKKQIEKLSATLHLLDEKPRNNHIYFAADRKEAKEISQMSKSRIEPTSVEVPIRIKKKTAASYRELAARKERASQLEKIYNEMNIQMECQKKGRKRKLRPDEIVEPTSGPVYRWSMVRKR
ncbi:hypothetical protein ACFE04_030337 [Oxalis oulophora]